MTVSKTPVAAAAVEAAAAASPSTAEAGAACWRTTADASLGPPATDVSTVLLDNCDILQQNLSPAGSTQQYCTYPTTCSSSCKGGAVVPPSHCADTCKWLSHIPRPNSTACA